MFSEKYLVKNVDSVSQLVINKSLKKVDKNKSPIKKFSRFNAVSLSRSVLLKYTSTDFCKFFTDLNTEMCERHQSLKQKCSQINTTRRLIDMTAEAISSG